MRQQIYKTFRHGYAKSGRGVEKSFPAARLLRMDADTTGRKGAHYKYLDAFEREEYDILLGTQMVAKGLIFLRSRW